MPVYLYRKSDGKVLRGVNDLLSFSDADAVTYGTVIDPSLATDLIGTGTHIYDGSQIRNINVAESLALDKNNASEIEAQKRREAMARVDDDPLIDAMLAVIGGDLGKTVSEMKADIKAELSS